MADGRPTDYRIEQDFPSTAIERWDANIRALRIVKALEQEQRHATPAEQRALSLYSGFGDSSFEQAFSYRGSRDPAWSRRREALEELVSEDELEGIRRSRLNAFFTTKPAIDAMWQGLVDMGADKIENPKILEPSAGSGRFLGLQPPKMAERSERTAVELDPLTAQVLKHTYPETRTYNAGFQDAPIRDGYYDIAISNVPFGDIRVNDPEYRATGRMYLTRRVHNYFFAKALDKLRPGGVLAFVTSHGTMDAPGNQPVRRYLADRADLIGAVRLPNDAFDDTDVVTDIMYLQKREPGEEPGDDSWVESEYTEIGYQDLPVNRYYLDNPDKVLGTPSAKGSMYGSRDKPEYTVRSTPGQPLTPQLQRQLAEATRGGRITEGKSAPATAEPAPTAYRFPERYVLEDGEVRIARQYRPNMDYSVSGDRPDLSKADAERVKDLIALRDAARGLIGQETDGTANEVVERSRDALRTQYEAYIAKHGQAINTPANRKLLAGGADDHLLFALERYDIESECWQPSSIMNQRVVGVAPQRHASTPRDALTITLDERGTLDFSRMGELLRRDPDDVREALQRDGHIFRTPASGAWVTAADYLSGDVREKLRTAQLAATRDVAFRANVDALEAAQPPLVEAHEIATPLGAPWMPTDILNDWIREEFRPDTYAGWRRDPIQEWVRYTEEGEAFIGQDEAGRNKSVGTTGAGGWVLVNKINSPGADAKWGTGKKSAQDILMHRLKGSPINVTFKDSDGKQVNDPAGTVAAQEKAAEMQRAFEDWLWKDEGRRERVVQVYNDLHNSHRLREYDGEHLTFPGMAREWQRKMRPHQRDGIARIITDGTALLGHEVGFGKTVTMIGGAMERKRLGLADKPMFIVPKATHEQFVSQFMETYPGAKVLSPDADDFKAGNRERFLASIATGDWDGIVLTSEQFERIPVSPDMEQRWIEQQKTEMVAALTDMDVDSAAGKRSQKQIQKRIENYDVRLQQLAAQLKSRSDDTLYFEDLGVDALYVDEADRYKNLPYATNMGGSRGGVKGLPQSESNRAWDMYMKIRSLQARTGQKADGRFAHGGIVFATGTPVANTIAETYTMMRYLQPDELQRRGTASFDAWALTYGNITNGVEQTATGTYRPVQRFAEFVNLPELSRLFQNVADIRIADEVPEMRAAQPKLVNEKGEQNKRITVVAPNHPALKAYMQEIVQRADRLGFVDPREDNMLKISSDARKASLDVRMVDRHAPYNPKGKVGLAAENIARIHREEEPDRGTQLVFLDLGTPKAKDGGDDEPSDEELTNEEQEILTNVYRSLRTELTARGVPDDEIAFIHDYKTPDQKNALFAQVRQGDIRVLVGSTEKIGVGVNVQDRAAAAHHIDVPWRPRDLEQREGRIVRQGNLVYGPTMDPETNTPLSPGRGVKIYQYVQEGSFDSFMWQTNEAKARGIKSLMRRETQGRRLADVDPFILSIAEAKALASGNPLVKRAEELKIKVNAGQLSLAAHRKQQDEARMQRGNLQHQVERWKTMLPRVQADAERVKASDDDFSATIQGQTYDKRPEAAQALADALQAVPFGQQRSLGSFKGFEVVGYFNDQGFTTIAKSDTGQEYTATTVDPHSVGPGVFTRLENTIKGIPDLAASVQGRLEQGENTLNLYTEQVNKPFASEQELAHAQRQLRVVQARIEEREEDDDPSVDVYAEYDADSPRETPDVDAMTLRHGVEIEHSTEDADTPAEVADELADELEEGLERTARSEPDEPPLTPEQVKAVEDVAEGMSTEGRVRVLAKLEKAIASRGVAAASDIAAPETPDKTEEPPAPPATVPPLPFYEIAAKVAADRAYANVLRNGDEQNARIELDKALARITRTYLDTDIRLFGQLADEVLADPNARAQLVNALYAYTAQQAIPGSPDAPDEPDDEPMSTAELQEAVAETRERQAREDAQPRPPHPYDTPEQPYAEAAAEPAPSPQPTAKVVERIRAAAAFIQSKGELYDDEEAEEYSDEAARLDDLADRIDRGLSPAEAIAAANQLRASSDFIQGKADLYEYGDAEEYTEQATRLEQTAQGLHQPTATLPGLADAIEEQQEAYAAEAVATEAIQPRIDALDSADEVSGVYDSPTAHTATPDGTEAVDIDPGPALAAIDTLEHDRRIDDDSADDLRDAIRICDAFHEMVEDGVDPESAMLTALELEHPEALTDSAKPDGDKKKDKPSERSSPKSTDDRKDRPAPRPTPRPKPQPVPVVAQPDSPSPIAALDALEREGKLDAAVAQNIRTAILVCDLYHRMLNAGRAPYVAMYMAVADEQPSALMHDGPDIGVMPERAPDPVVARPRTPQVPPLAGMSPLGLTPVLPATVKRPAKRSTSPRRERVPR